MLNLLIRMLNLLVSDCFEKDVKLARNFGISKRMKLKAGVITDRLLLLQEQVETDQL